MRRARLSLRGERFVRLRGYVVDCPAEKKDPGPPPARLPVLRENVPAALVALDQWVLWRDDLNDKGEWAKVPYGIKGYRAKVNNRATWNNFNAVLDRYLNDHQGNWSGVGFVFSEDDQFAGVDLDDCRDPATGRLSDHAWDLIMALGTYTEVSPSGTGVKLFLEAAKPGSKCAFKIGTSHLGKVEVYDSGRWFAVTGHLVPDCPCEVAKQQKALDHVYSKRFVLDANEPLPQVQEQLDHLDRQETEQRTSNGKGRLSVEDRAVAYLRKCPPAISKQNGHGTTFAVARAVVWGFDLGADRGFDLLWSHYNPTCQPAWSEAELRHKCRDADVKEFNKPRGYLLDAQRPPPADTAGAKGGGGASDPRPPGEGGRSPPESPPNGFRWQPISTRDLMTATKPPRWLVQRQIVEGQPLVIGAPQKAGKTSVAIDLAISLSMGTPFLGFFATCRPVRVAMISGESGRWAIMNLAREVCRARGISWGEVNVTWQFNLPRLPSAADLAELGRGIKGDGVEVLIVDPLYLCLLSGAADLQASNLYQMGPLLLDVASLCIEAGATPVMLHHTNRPANAKREPLELSDLAFAGISEFARQWILLNRREPFEPGQPSKLWMTAGGSCGQSGTWAIDVDEGALRDDFTGRRWNVTVTPRGNVIEEQRTAAARKKQDAELQKERDEEATFLRTLDLLDPCAKGVTQSAIRAQAKFSGDRASAIQKRLIEEGLIQEVPVMVANGKTSQRATPGIRRTKDDDEG
jgi:hypothetical protein